MTITPTSSAQARKGRIGRGWFITAVTFATLFWIFHFPYRQDDLYRVLSPDALWVSEHDRLSDRWDDMANNPVLLGVLSGMNVPPADVQDFMTRGPWRGVIRLMTGRHAVISYEEGAGRFDKPAWVFASAVGGPIQLVRWNVIPRLIPNMKPLDVGLQRRVWAMPVDSKKSRTRRQLIVTTQDGMLIGVISENPMIMRTVVSRLNRSSEERELGWFPGQAFEDQPYSDRAWLRGIEVDGLGKLPEMTVGCTAQSGSGVSGEVRLPSIHVSPDDVMDTQSAAGLCRLLSTNPDTFVCGSESFLKALGVVPSKSANWQVVVNAIRETAPSARSICAALMSESYSGRIHGIKIRSVLLGFPVGAGVTVDQALGPIVEHINQQESWGLTTQAQLVDGHQVLLLDSQEKQLVAGLDPSDKPACLVLDGWFFMTSNLSALEKLVRTPVPAEDPALSARLSTSLYVRSRLDETHGAVRNLLSVYLLSQMFQESAAAKNERIRSVYETMNQWASVTRILKEAELWVETTRGGGGLTIAARIGPTSNTLSTVTVPGNQKGLN